MRRLIYMIGIISFILSNECFAIGCNTVNIIITNNTSSLCRLEHSNLKHGYFEYISSPPSYIPPHTASTPFFVSQSFHGSHLELTYTCGNHQKITLLNHHDYEFLAAGEMKGKVTQSENIMAEHQSSKGSCLWNQHGSIHWLIE